jgi:hypothetical protein
MDENERQRAFISAMTTEHLALQTAASATISEAASRTSLYVFSLSSSLVAMGFVSRSPETFWPFAATILPALFILGLFTIVRLIDTGIENQQYLRRIARIRGYYRTLTAESADLFSTESGSWPEGRSPPLWAGSLVAFLTTAATMIAFINSIVAGTGVTLLANNLLRGGRLGLAVGIGAFVTAALMALLVAYQRWRYRSAEPASSE